jgi:twitching motility two-component system response regulator PilH
MRMAENLLINVGMKTILFVEDDPIIVRVYCTKFLREGFLVEVAEDGLAAVKMLPTVKPDLVVLDLMMPRFNGVDVLKFIRSDPVLKATPVIILSNGFMSDLGQAATAMGAELALLKSGCTPAQLVAAAGKLLGCAILEVESSRHLAVKEPSVW